MNGVSFQQFDDFDASQEDFLNAKQCAEYLRISESYFYKLRKKYPDLPSYEFGRRRYYKGAEVRRFLFTQGQGINVR